MTTIKLEVRTSPTESCLWQHNGTRFIVGRGSECDLQIKGELAHLASGRHLQITAENGKLFVTDLESTNGTFIDGNQVRGKLAVPIDKEIHIGRGGPRIRITGFESSPTRPVTSPPKSSARDSPEKRPAGTQLLLVNLQKQHRQTLFVVIGACVLGVSILAAAVMLTRAGDSATVASNGEPKLPSPIPPERDEPPERPTSSERSRAKKRRQIPPPEPEPLTVDEILASNKQGVAWLGYIHKEEKKYIFAPACVVAPNRIVTTAEIALQLMKLEEEHFEVIARCQDQQSKILAFELHPSFDKSHIEKSSNVFYNVAIGQLANRFRGRCDLSEEEQPITENSTLTFLGFHHDLGVKQPYDSKRVTLRGDRIQVAELQEHVNDPSMQLAVLRTGSKSPKPGSPVFDGQGLLVGMVAPKGKQMTVVPLPIIRSFATH